MLISSVSASDLNDNSTSVNTQITDDTLIINNEVDKQYDEIKMITPKNENKLGANQNIVYVNSKGNSTSNGNTRNNPTTIDNAFKNIRNNTIITLITNQSSDTYILNKNYTINNSVLKNNSNFRIVGDNNKNIIIDGRNNKAFLNVFGKYNFTLANITFQNFKKSAVSAVYSNVNIENCIFKNNNIATSNSLISSHISNITLSKNTFGKNNVNNWANLIHACNYYGDQENFFTGKSNIKMLNNNFTNIKTNIEGYMISLDDITVTSTANIFKNITTCYVMEINGNQGSIRYNVFDNVTAEWILSISYSFVTIQNNIFRNSYMNSGVLQVSYLNSINLLFNNFINIKSNSTLISLDNINVVNMDKLLFENNNVNDSIIINIYDTDLSKFNIKNSTFKSNKNNGYGLINVVSYNNVSIESSIFTNNTSRYNGGAIFVDKSKKCTIKNSTFISNTGRNGGAIFIDRSLSNITQCIFTNNTATSNGGAVVTLGGQYTNITSSTFTNNNAVYDGGAVYNVRSDLQILSSKFEKNMARSAGAVYTIYNTQDIVTNLTELIIINHIPKTIIIESTFIDNNARINVSTIYANRNIQIKNSVLVSNNKTMNLLTITNPLTADINKNWWGENTPDFNILTNNIIPKQWRVLRSSYSVSNNVTTVTLSANVLNDLTIYNTSMPSRVVEYSSTNGSFKYKSTTLKNTVSNVYTGNISNAVIILDNQVLKLNTKEVPYIYYSNVTLLQNQKAQLNITTNKDFKNNIIIKLNNKQIASIKTTTGNITYTIPQSNIQNPNTYKLIISYGGDTKYDKIEKVANVLVKSNKYTQSLITQTTKADVINTTKLTYPSKYDLRTIKQVTPVKNQGSQGACTDFALISALESAYLKQKNISLDLSEGHLRNFLGRYSLVGSDTYPAYDNNDSYGDERYFALDNILNWYNPVNESQDSYDDRNVLSPMIYNTYHIQDVLFIKSRNSPSDNNAIKDAIMKYGAVATTVYMNSFMIEENVYNYNNDYESLHAVAIVGWDDNYDKNNFKVIDEYGETHIPPANGAFIVKNSWGTDNIWDENYTGFHYISYYDRVIANSSEQSVAFILKNNDEYDNVYNYEFSRVGVSYSPAKSIEYKQIYTINKDELITAIGTYTLSPSKYNIEVQVNNQKVYTQSGTLTTSGYRTIRLNKYIPVEMNDDVTVIVRLDATKGYFEGYMYGSINYTDYMTTPRSSISLDNVTMDGGTDDEFALVKMYTINKVTNKTAKISVKNLYSTDNYIVLNLTATNNNGQKLTNGRISVSLNGVWIGSPRVVNGQANMYAKIRITNPNNNKLVLTYINSNEQRYKDITQTLNINKSKQQITITTDNQQLQGYPIQIKIAIKDQNNKVINTGRVLITFNGKWIGSPGFKNNISTLTYNIPSDFCGKYIISATYIDSKNVVNSVNYREINVLEEKNKITIIAPLQAEAKNKITITTKVSDITTGNNVNTGRVSLTFNGKWIGSPGFKNNISSMVYNIPSEYKGNYTITATYIDSKNVTSGKSESKIKIDKIKQRIILTTQTNIMAGNKITISVKAIDITTNKTINTGRISLAFNNKWIESPAIKNNIATMEYIVPAEYNGNYQISATYINSNNTIGTITGKIIKVSPVKQKITINIQKTLKSGQKLQIKLLVRDAKNNTINTGRVSITFNGKWIGSPGFKNNIATMNYTIPIDLQGTYTLRATYIDTNNKIQSSNQTQIKVTK